MISYGSDDSTSASVLPAWLTMWVLATLDVQVAGAVGVEEREALLEALGADPPIAVPGGAAALDADAVDHSVAGEPMRGRLSRVRPVA